MAVRHILGSIGVGVLRRPLGCSLGPNLLTSRAWGGACAAPSSSTVIGQFERHFAKLSAGVRVKAKLAKLEKQEKLERGRARIAERAAKKNTGEVQLTTTESVIRKRKPTTPSQRHTAMVDKRNLWRGRPVKALTVGMRKKGGRNNYGHLTSRNRGGGHKRRYRIIDFLRNYYDQPAVVQRFEHDPNRSAFIALIAYPDGNVSYIIAPKGLEVGDTVISSKEQEIEIKPGNSMPLANIPIGVEFHNLEVKPGKGAIIARSAGTYCMLMDKGSAKEGHALVNICSKEQRFVPLECMGTIGVVSNEAHHLQKLGKAGRARWMGRKPHVRGVAMNPVDHPMGGGEGRSSGGRHSCSPKGLLSKGFRTVKKIRNKLVVSRRKK